MLIRHFVFLAFSFFLSTVGYGQNPISRDLPDDVSVTRDLVYATYGDRSLMLDLYQPRQRDAAPLPVIIVIRGGGWTQGDKDGFGPMAAALAKRGFAAASIEYRASGEAAFPAAVEDTKAAVRWLRANAEKYDLDSEAIGVIGGSAGAHLAALLGMTADVPELEGNGGNPNQSTALSAVVGLATPADFTFTRSADSLNGSVVTFLGASYEEDPDVWDTASPIHYVAAASPPLLLVHSESDNVVPFEQSFRLAKSYGAAGVPVELVLIPDAPHAFWNSTEWFDDTMDRAARFFWRHLELSP